MGDMIGVETLISQVNVNNETPFVCNVKALDGAERDEQLRLTRRLAQALLKTTELPDGYAIQIDVSLFSVKDLATWTDFERRCCPFFDFALEMPDANRPVTLRLTGREGVKEFIRVELPTLVSR
jgi:hypothetical protein